MAASWLSFLFVSLLYTALLLAGIGWRAWTLMLGGTTLFIFLLSYAILSQSWTLEDSYRFKQDHRLSSTCAGFSVSCSLWCWLIRWACVPHATAPLSFAGRLPELNSLRMSRLCIDKSWLSIVPYFIFARRYPYQEEFEQTTPSQCGVRDPLLLRIKIAKLSFYS